MSTLGLFEQQDKIKADKRKKVLFVALSVVFVLGTIGVVAFFLTNRTPPPLIRLLFMTRPCLRPQIVYARRLML
jgi:hypothetical protein